MIFSKHIRKYYGVAAAAVLSACMLFGCTRADVASSSLNVSKDNGSAEQGTVKATAADDSLAGAGSGSEQKEQNGPDAQQVAGTTATSTAAQTSQDAQASQTTQSSQTSQSSQDSQISQTGQTSKTPAPVSGQTAQNVSGTTTQTAQTQQGTQTAQPSDTNPDPASQNPQESVSEAPAGNTLGTDAVVESISGEFEKNDGSESVQIALINDNQISFQFRESGIGATAQASGSAALYSGDDGYSISFDIAGDNLAVTVNGEGGEDSPINGIYYRVLDGGSGEEEEDQEDDGSDEDFEYYEEQ